MERPREVLPTPGGPTRHRIDPLLSAIRDRTAIYSTMRCFTWTRRRVAVAAASRALVVAMGCVAMGCVAMSCVGLRRVRCFIVDS